MGQYCNTEQEGHISSVWNEMSRPENISLHVEVTCYSFQQTDRVARCNSEALDLYSGGSGFKSRLNYRQF